MGGGGGALTPPVAVVLARGLGARMRRDDPLATLDAAQGAAAAAGHKALMPLDGHPLVDHLLSRLADAGVTEAVLVVPPGPAPLRDWCAAPRAGGRRVHVRFAEQAEPRGTADAVVAAAALVGERDALVVNGDNLYPVCALADAAALQGPGLVAFTRDGLETGNLSPERLASFATVTTDGEGWLTEIVEKPATVAPGALLSMNLWRLTPALVACCARVAPSPRGELELPDAVRIALHDGARVRVLVSDEPVLDCSWRADVAGLAQAVRGEHPRP